MVFLKYIISWDFLISFTSASLHFQKLKVPSSVIWHAWNPATMSQPRDRRAQKPRFPGSLTREPNQGWWNYVQLVFSSINWVLNKANNSYLIKTLSPSPSWKDNDLDLFCFFIKKTVIGLACYFIRSWTGPLEFIIFDFIRNFRHNKKKKHRFWSLLVFPVHGNPYLVTYCCKKHILWATIVQT